MNCPEGDTSLFVIERNNFYEFYERNKFCSVSTRYADLFINFRRNHELPYDVNTAATISVREARSFYTIIYGRVYLKNESGFIYLPVYFTMLIQQIPFQ